MAAEPSICVPPTLAQPRLLFCRAPSMEKQRNQIDPGASGVPGKKGREVDANGTQSPVAAKMVE
jgi:hypothetical protein